MSFKFGDRVQETTTTTGTGTYTLGGAATGYQAFSSVLSNADTCYYAATDGTNWEVGLGTYTSAGTTLARTTIIASSNANAAVNWSAGTKNIWLNLPATIFSTPIAIQVFTASGTYTPNAAMTSALVFGVGAGGGGGGISGANSAGGGGGGGELGWGIFSAATIGTSQTVTIGAGGTAGSTGPGAGGTGGTTSLGALLTMIGGSGGSAGSSSGVLGGAGGTGGTGGSFHIPGNGGGGNAGVTGSQGMGGYGGAGFFGGAPKQPLSAGTSVAFAGSANSGAGGSAASGATGGGALAGGVGGTGFLVVIEFLG